MRLLIFISLLFFPSYASAQKLLHRAITGNEDTITVTSLSSIGVYRAGVVYVTSVNYNDLADALFERVSTSISDSFKIMYSMVYDSLSDIILNADAFYLMGSEFAELANQNLVQDTFNLIPSRVTGNFYPDFIPYLGYNGDGAGSYLETMFNPTSANGKYSRYNALIGNASYSSVNAAKTSMGAFDAVSVRALLQRNNSGNISYGINRSGVTNYSSANHSGLIIAQRTADNNSSLYLNGDSVSGATNESYGLLNNEIVLLGRASSTAWTEFVTDTMYFAIIGKSLNTEQHDRLNRVLNIYKNFLLRQYNLTNFQNKVWIDFAHNDTNQSSIIIRSSSPLNFNLGHKTITLSGNSLPQTIRTDYNYYPRHYRSSMYGGLSGVRSIRIHNNYYVAPILGSLSYLTNLDTLYIDGKNASSTTWYSGEFPLSKGEFGVIPNLRYLYAHNMGRTMSGLLDSINFPKLEVADLSYTDVKLITSRLPKTLKELYYTSYAGYPSVYIDSIPNSLERLTVGYTTLDGNMNRLSQSSNLQHLDVDAVVGVVDLHACLDSLPPRMKHICIGRRSTDTPGDWTGSLNSLNDYENFVSLDLIRMGDSISGSLDSLDNSVYEIILDSTGTSKVTGMTRVPTSLSKFGLTYNNLATFNLSIFSANMTSIKIIDCSGVSYTPGTLKDYASINIFIYHNSMTQANVDAMLNELASIAPTAILTKLIDLSGSNQARSAASNSAVTTLQGLGFTVITN